MKIAHVANSMPLIQISFLIERISRRLRRGKMTNIRVRQECLTYKEVGRTFLSVNTLMIPQPLGRSSSLIIFVNLPAIFLHYCISTVSLLKKHIQIGYIPYSP